MHITVVEAPECERLIYGIEPVRKLLSVFFCRTLLYEHLPVLVGIVGDRHIPFILGDTLLRPIFNQQDARQNDGSSIQATVQPLNFDVEGFILKDWLPTVREQPLHHPLRPVGLVKYRDAILAGRPDAEG